MEFVIKAKNAIKKIAAISTGAVFIGATMMSAVAAASDLSTFPAPFVSGGAGAFTIVVGQDALPADIIGAVDVGVGLQASATAGGGGAPAAVSGESAKVEQAGNPLNLAQPDGTVPETFGDMIGAGLDDSDLPTILADGNYDDSKGNTDNEEGYTQRINFDAVDGPRLVYDRNDDGKKEVGDYVRVPNNKQVNSFKLDFDSNIDFDDTDAGTISDDLENTRLDIQGKPYIITSAKDNDADGKLDELELLTGKAIVTLTQGDTYTFEGHTVLVTSVTDPNAPTQRCGVSVDGTTKFIDEGNDEKFDDLRVGVSDVFAIHGAVGEDACELTLGSVVTKLKEGDDVQINGIDIGDREGDPDVSTMATIDSPVAGEWGGFTVETETDDELNLGSTTDGSDWTDPIFGNFKISYLGLSGNTENINFEAGTDDGSFTFTNNEGKAVEIPVFSGDNAALFFGDDSNSMLLFESFDPDIDGNLEGATNCEDGDIDGNWGDTRTTDVNGDGTIFKYEDAAIVKGEDVSIGDLEGTKLLVNSAGQTTRVLELQKIDTDNDEVTFKDDTTGGTKTVNVGDGTLDLDGSDETFDVSGIGEITLQFEETANCDGADDLAAVTLVDGNLADAYAQNVESDDIDADGGNAYETNGENVFVLNEELAQNDDGDGDSGDNDGDAEIAVQESSDISDTPNDEVITEMIFDDGEDEVLVGDQDNEDQPFSVNGYATSGGGFLDQSTDNDNDRYAATTAGSIWHVHQDDSGNIKTADVTLAVGEARNGNAFVAETGALFTAPTPSGPSTPATTQPFVGAVARLDTEVTDKTASNLILIGGPCVNRLTAEALGLTYPACGTEVATTLGIPLDGAQIALWDNAFGGTKTAMTVIGVGPDETRAATEVLKRHSEFRAQLVGTKVNVKSTAGVITVSAPTVA